jgi:hypothetical protein
MGFIMNIVNIFVDEGAADREWFIIRANDENFSVAYLSQRIDNVALFSWC